MRTPLMTVLLAAVLAAAGCSSSTSATGDDGPPVLSLTQLKARLVTAAQAGLTGYGTRTSQGEQQSHTSTADRSFDRTGSPGFVQVSLIASTNATNAALALTVGADPDLRPGSTRRSLTVGRHGVTVHGRDKIDGTEETQLQYTEGAVAVLIFAPGTTLTDAQLEALAQAQDADLRQP